MLRARSCRMILSLVPNLSKDSKTWATRICRWKNTMAQQKQTGSEVMASLSNRVYLFNFFEKPSMDEKGFVDFWSDAAKYIQTRDHFISTHLHQAVSSADIRFSWVNFAVFDSADVCCFGKPDPVWMEKLKSGAVAKLTAFPGQYSEIASYKGNPLDESPKQRPEKERFLLTAVAADESVSNEDLEKNWKSWMKADFISEKLKQNGSWKDTLLYRMEKSRNPQIRYNVRTELSEMGDQEGQALVESINQQPDVAGVRTFTGIYQIHTNMDYKKE